MLHHVITSIYIFISREVVSPPPGRRSTVAVATPTIQLLRASGGGGWRIGRWQHPHTVIYVYKTLIKVIPYIFLTDHLHNSATPL